MELYILNPSLQIEGMVDDVESKLWQKKYNDVGESEIYSPYTEKLHALLRRGNYIYRYDDDMACIITDVQITTDIEEGDYITTTAKDVCTILSGRIVRWPIVFTGAVGDFVGKLLSDNVVNTDPAYRSIPNFRVDETSLSAVSATIEASAQTEDLLALIIAVCKSAGCGFRVRVDIAEGCFVFALYKGVDRTTGDNGYVEFSPAFANILDTNYHENDENYKNVVYVGYKDMGEKLQLLSVYRDGVEPQGIDRKEVYIDGTGTSREITLEELKTMYPNCAEIDGIVWNDSTKLFEIATVEGSGRDKKYTVWDVVYVRIIKRLGTEAFANYERTQEFSGAVDTVDTYAYKEDYNLGDIVVAANRYGISAPARIVEVMESDDNEDGYQVEPVFEF